jgi:hypothetical protein
MDAVERVRNMVRHSLVASPNVKNKELFDRAREIAPEVVKDLTIQQFHAKFRLPVLRNEMGRKNPGQPRSGRRTGTSEGANGSGPSPRKRTTRSARRSRASAPSGQQAAVRDVLVEFAMDLEKAESRSDLIRVMGDMDSWVARILDAARGARPRRAGPETTAASNGRVTESPTTVD